MQITVFETVHKMPKRQPRSRNEESDRDQNQFDPQRQSDTQQGSSSGGNSGSQSSSGYSGGSGNPLAGKFNMQKLVVCNNIRNMISIFTIHKQKWDIVDGRNYTYFVVYLRQRHVTVMILA